MQVRIYGCLLDIACGADYIHSLDILHGDLKPANCLLCTRGCSSSSDDDAQLAGSSAAMPAVTCKVADFGLSRLLATDASHLTTQTHGTVSYMPPELLRDGVMSRSADVYSFGILSTRMCLPMCPCRKLARNELATPKLALKLALMNLVPGGHTLFSRMTHAPANLLAAQDLLRDV